MLVFVFEISSLVLVDRIVRVIESFEYLCQFTCYHRSTVVNKARVPGSDLEYPKLTIQKDKNTPKQSY